MLCLSFPYLLCGLSRPRAKGRNSLRTVRRLCLFPYLWKACPSSLLASIPFLIFALSSFAYRGWHVSCLRPARSALPFASARRFPSLKMFYVERRGKALPSFFTKRWRFLRRSALRRAWKRGSARKVRSGTGESRQSQPNKGVPSPLGVFITCIPVYRKPKFEILHPLNFTISQVFALSRARPHP